MVWRWSYRDFRKIQNVIIQSGAARCVGHSATQFVTLKDWFQNFCFYDAGLIFISAKRSSYSFTFFFMTSRRGWVALTTFSKLTEEALSFWFEQEPYQYMLVSQAFPLAMTHFRRELQSMGFDARSLPLGL